MKRKTMVAIGFACFSGVMVLAGAYIWQGRGNAYRVIESRDVFSMPTASIDEQIQQKVEDLRLDCMICQALVMAESTTNANASVVRADVLKNVRRIQSLRQLKRLTNLELVRKAADSAGCLYSDEEDGICYRVEDFIARRQKRSVAGWAKKLCLAWMMANGLFVAFLFRREVFPEC